MQKGTFDYGTSGTNEKSGIHAEQRAGGLIVLFYPTNGASWNEFIPHLAVAAAFFWIGTLLGAASLPNRYEAPLLPFFSIGLVLIGCLLAGWIFVTKQVNAHHPTVLAISSRTVTCTFPRALLFRKVQRDRRRFKSIEIISAKVYRSSTVHWWLELDFNFEWPLRIGSDHTESELRNLLPTLREALASPKSSS